jgi:hypothetical protein
LIWIQSHRADPFARDIADRHYSRQRIGYRNFVQPGSCVVFKTMTLAGRAYWVTSWPYARYVKHAWGGAWLCSAFRNENAGIASEMIRDAIAATRAHYVTVPELGMVTFIDRAKVKPTPVHGRPVWGWSFMKAGFTPVGETKSGLLVLQMLPERMPFPEPALIDVFS